MNEIEKLRAEVEILRKRDAFFADACCHYRNLAIVLGAKPDQMIGTFDKALCESGIDPDETSGGYHVSINEQLTELHDVWDQLARKETECDSAYHERNQLVSLLTKLFPAGVKRTEIAGWDPAWYGCVFIDFPWGQASWHYHDSQAALFSHLGPYTSEWDGHSTQEKYAKIGAAEFADTFQDLKDLREENSFIKSEYRDAAAEELAEDALYMANRALKAQVKNLSSALSAAKGMIAANRLVLGEYMGVRYIMDLEKKIKYALEEEGK